MTPPRLDTTTERADEIARAALTRLETVGADALILYDVDAESDRSDTPRPFPYLPMMDPALFHGRHLSGWTGPVIVYRAVGQYVPDDLGDWLTGRGLHPRRVVRLRLRMPGLRPGAEADDPDRAPCGSAKTLEFMSWLGIDVPRWLQTEIVRSQDPLAESYEQCLTNARILIAFCRRLGLPFGINIESLTNRKIEIEASIELARETRALLRR